jgi:RNA polymerase sigma-70 factor (ECF subfamily)
LHFLDDAPAVVENATAPRRTASHVARPAIRVSASDDSADVARVLAGEVDAFEGIVRRWQGPLVNLAYRFCRDRGRAEEMAQDAFVRAYRALATWRQDAAFSTWLFALSMNVYRSHLRRVPPPALSLDAVAEPVRPGGQRDDLERADRDATIRAAVQTLPPRYRDAMTLFYFQDMDIASAARTLGVAEGTLKARLFRARDLLRRKLEDVRS